MSWHQSVEGLTRTAATEVTDARRRRDEIVVAAKGLAPFADALLVHPQGDVLAALLCRLETIATVTAPPRRPVENVDRLVAHFVDALANSVDAVRYCRLTEHPSGRCWFDDGAGRALCGEILRVAHHLGH